MPMRAWNAPLLFAAVLGVAACNWSSSSGDSAGDGDAPRVPDTDAPPVTEPFKDYGTVLNVLPPGQDDNGGLANASLPVPLPVSELGDVITEISGQTGLVPALAEEPHFDDQLSLYDSLVHSDPGLTDGDLAQYFKAESLRGRDDGPWENEATVAAGGYRVDIKRDGFGVPHIFAESRDDALFGMGYATAADRLFLLDVLRRAGRGELSRFLGPADFSFDRDIAFGAPYREADRARQIQETRAEFGEAGDRVFADVEAFVAGLNTYASRVRNGLLEMPIEYLALGLTLEDFVIEDVHAIATLIQSIFAGGGGGEAENLRLLHALHEQVGDAGTACRLWRDIRHADDPASSVTTTETFATQSPRTLDDDICPLQPAFAGDYPGNAVFDPGSYQPHPFFRTEPCGRPGQDLCPETTGNLPQLPGTGPLGELLESILGGLLARDRSPDVDVPLLASSRRDAGPALDARRTEAVRQRVAAIAEGLSDLASGRSWRMSNALLVGGAHTASGNPIAVFGPQTSYFVPQLLLEMAVHGGDLHTRGMTFTGLPYVVIGRGPDFAWSATSGGSDLTDVRAVRLCAAEDGQPRSGYRVNGACKPFDTFRETWSARWNLAVPMDDPAEIGQNHKVTRDIIRTDEYGPVFAFATVDGVPVALTRQRSTYGAELETAVPFFLATRNDVHDADSFQRVFETTTGSFNWFYIDRDDIAYHHSGLYPLRPGTVHPDLPAWGDGGHDWKGFLPFERHPRAVNPERGYLASWNNRPAPGWWSADSNAGFGPVHRNDMLDVRLQALVTDGNVTRGDVVEAMADAGTVDLRGQEVLPAALDVLETESLNGDQAEAVALLREWIEGGAMRRDRDGDGQYDAQAAVALMDAWYGPMIEAVLPQITPLEDVAGESRMIVGRDNAPGPMGSAYQAGYYGYLRRVFEMALDREERPYRELACAGTGEPAACRAALAASLDQALADLGGIGNRDSWNANEARDRIQHRAIGLASVPAIDWQNRPTFQQVVEFIERR